MKIYRLAQDKILYIMRGISGSGKSTLAKQIGGLILGSDEFWMVNGKYQFDENRIGEAHQWNQNRAAQAMQQGISPIIVDNTNVQAWEAKPYVEAAVANGYRVQVVEPNTPWKFNAEELAKRNRHGTPKERIEEMIQQWEPNLTVQDILNSTSPTEEGSTTNNQK